MTYNDIRKNENKGFSLIELIVVVAIMAVLVAVLAPSLLAYVERSRAQKDDSAMSEVTNAVRLALADQDIYDEMLTVNVPIDEDANLDGVSVGYASTTDELPANFSTTKMRGATITFQPTDAVMTIAGGLLNYDGTEGNFDALSTLAATTARIESIVGKTIELTSQTYRNSDYTVFIKMSTLSQEDAGITVKGEWNGTNLPADDGE